MLGKKPLYKDFKLEHDVLAARFVLDYQTVNDYGKVTGKKSHLEASSLEDLIRSVIQSHSEAVAALERIKHKQTKFLANKNLVCTKDRSEDRTGQ